MGVRLGAVAAGRPVADGVYAAPLGEPRAQLDVLLQAVAQAVEALGHLLAGGAGQRVSALVDLDTGDHPLTLYDLDQGRAVGAILAQRLVVQDYPADVLVGARRREQQLTVVPTVALGRLDADAVEPPLDRTGALVRGKDALAGGDHGPRRLVEPLDVHAVLLGRVPNDCPSAGLGTRNDRHRLFHFAPVTEYQRRPLVPGPRLDVQDSLAGGVGRPSRLLDHVPQRVGLVHQPQLPLRALDVARVQEYSALQQVAMEVGHQGADVPERVAAAEPGHGPLGRLVELAEVALVRAVVLALLRDADAGVRQDEVSRRGVQREAGDLRPESPRP